MEAWKYIHPELDFLDNILHSTPNGLFFSPVYFDQYSFSRNIIKTMRPCLLLKQRPLDLQLYTPNFPLERKSNVCLQKNLRHKHPYNHSF